MHEVFVKVRTRKADFLVRSRRIERDAAESARVVVAFQLVKHTLERLAENATEDPPRIDRSAVADAMAAYE